MNDIASMRKMRPLSLGDAFGFWTEEGLDTTAMGPLSARLAEDLLLGDKE